MNWIRPLGTIVKFCESFDTVGVGVVVLTTDARFMFAEADSDTDPLLIKGPLLTLLFRMPLIGFGLRLRLFGCCYESSSTSSYYSLFFVLEEE